MSKAEQDAREWMDEAINCAEIPYPPRDANELIVVLKAYARHQNERLQAELAIAKGTVAFQHDIIVVANQAC